MSSNTTTPTLAVNTAKVIDYDTKDFDSDTAVSTGLGWRFVVPAGKSGVYRISARLAITSDSAAAGNALAIFINVNGVDTSTLSNFIVQASSTAARSTNGSDLVNLNDGDALCIRGLSTISGGTETINTGTPPECWISIERVLS